MFPLKCSYIKKFNYKEYINFSKENEKREKKTALTSMSIMSPWSLLGRLNKFECHHVVVRLM